MEKNQNKWDVQHWVFGSVFLKQPALPGEAPPKKNSSKKILKNKTH
jgi:hypothetical protein